MRTRPLWIISLILLAAAAILFSCGKGGSGAPPSRSTGNATVSVTLSDPATCSAPQGPFSHIFLTIADVRANPSATAQPSDTGWTDLTPSLASSPVQIDMLGTPNSQCFLANLVTGTQIAPATFQQIRVVLLDNTQAVKLSSNKCGTTTNCVIPAVGGIQPLNLVSESTTGILIPPTQISGSKFSLSSGDNKTLNIDIDSCASVVIQANGSFALKPVLFAGEVGSSSASISGRVLDSVKQSLISGGKVVVALEQADSRGVDRVIMETVPDGSGTFTFCPVPTGSFDVVAVAIDGSGVAFAATITTGVQPGANLGNVPLVAQTGPNQSPANLTGQITTAGTSGGTSASLAVSALQTFTLGTATIAATIPEVFSPAATLSLVTAPSVSCPANTQCVNYTLVVPAMNPSIGQFAAGGISYTQTSGTVNFNIGALAFIPGSGNIPNCTPAEIIGQPITVTPGTTINAPVISFTGCQ